MRFHAVMIVRDEADVIGECVEHLLTWCDSLFIYDTGSTDGTWDLVHDAARKDRRVSPVGRAPVIAEGDTRGYVFTHVRDGFHTGDWIARVDADEFYHYSPREWLPSNIAPHEGRVFAQMYEFMLTTADHAASELGLPCRAIDRSLPIQERINRYLDHSVLEPRFFRFRRGMHWAPDHPNPWNPGLPAARRIPVRHYRWRTFEQMKRRCALRRVMARLSHHGVHWDYGWRECLIDEHDPQLYTWRPGQELRHVNDINHLPSGPRKIAQHTLYRSGLPAVLDLFRRGWPKGRVPRPLPVGFDAEVERSLSETEGTNCQAAEADQQVPPPSTRKNASMS